MANITMGSDEDHYGDPDLVNFEDHEDLGWQIDYNRRLLLEMNTAISILRVRVAIQLFVVIVLGVVVIASAVWHFEFGFRNRDQDYEVIIGAASVFGLFFFYETAASAVSVFSRWQRGLRIRRNQMDALKAAEGIYGSVHRA